MHILVANTRISFNDMKLKYLSVSKFHGFLYLEEVSMFSQSFICSFFSNCRIIFFFFAEVQEILEESNDVAAKDRGTTCFRSTSINNHSSVLLIYLRKKTSALTLLSSCLICFPFTNLSFPLSFLSQLLLKPFLLPLFSVLSDRWFSWHYEQCLFLQEKHFLLYIVFPFSSGPAYPKDVLVFFLF